MKRFVFLTSAILTFGRQAAVMAQEKTGYLQYKEPSPIVSTTSTVTVIGYIISLVLVLVVVAYLAFYASKLLGKNYTKNRVLTSEKIIATLPLGINKNLCLVELGKKVLVLSITEQNINFVKEITDLQEIEDLKQEFKNSQVAESVFLNDDILKIQQIKEKLTKKLLEFRNGKREK